MVNKNIIKGHDEYFDIYFLKKAGKNKIFLNVYDHEYKSALPVPAHKYKVYDTIHNSYQEVRFQENTRA